MRYIVITFLLGLTIKGSSQALKFPERQKIFLDKEDYIDSIVLKVKYYRETNFGGPLYTELHKVAVIEKKYCSFKPLKGKAISFTNAGVVRSALLEKKRFLLEISFAYDENEGFQLLGFCDINGGFFFKPLQEIEPGSERTDQ